MTLPGQMELATVIDHKARMDLISILTSDGAKNLEDVLDPNSPHGRWLTNDDNKPLGVRLAKMLNQYDDQPSSQLWNEIQGLAREILR